MTYGEQVRKEINRLYATGNYTYKQLAKKFNMSISTVGVICKDHSRVELEQKRREERIFKMESEAAKKSDRPKKKVRHNKQEVCTNLIESMSDYAATFGWSNKFLIDTLFQIGISKRDFEAAGYREFMLDVMEREAI